MPRSGAGAGAQQLRRAQEARSRQAQLEWTAQERRSLDNKPEPKWGLGYSFAQGRVIDRVWDIFKKEWAYWLQPPASAMSQHEISILESQLMNDANEQQPKSIVDIIDAMEAQQSPESDAVREARFQAAYNADAAKDAFLDGLIETPTDPMTLIDALALAETNRRAQIAAEEQAKRQAEVEAEKRHIADKLNTFFQSMGIPVVAQSNIVRLGDYLIEGYVEDATKTVISATSKYINIKDAVRLHITSASLSQDITEWGFEYDYELASYDWFPLNVSPDERGELAIALQGMFAEANLLADTVCEAYTTHFSSPSATPAPQAEAPATDQRIESLLATVTALTSRLSAMERLLEQAQIEDDEPIYMLTEAGKALADELASPQWEVKTLVQWIADPYEADPELADHLNNGWEVMHMQIVLLDAVLHRIVTMRRELPLEPQPEPLPPMPDDDDQQGEQSPTLPKRKPIAVDGTNVTMLSREMDEYLATHPMARDIWNGMSVEEAKQAANQRAAEVYTNVILKAHAEYLAECEDDSDLLQPLFLTAQDQKDTQDA